MLSPLLLGLAAAGAVLDNTRLPLDQHGDKLITGEAGVLHHNGTFYLYTNDWNVGNTCPGVDCCAEDVLGAGQIGGMHLGLAGRFDCDDRSRMDDCVAAVDRRLDRGAIGDVAGDDLAAVDVHALEECCRLRRRSHHHSDIVSVAPQRPDGVAPEKAGRSGDEDLHCPTSTSV